MHADEFLKEVLESPICPKNFEEIYKEFQHYQQLAIGTLNEFHRVCEKNSIPYQLAFGSLLGAVRDGGQIPWDYDIDVWVPYNDIPALIKALQKDLSEDYCFYCHQCDSHWDHYMMRLAPKGYRPHVLHVDVFYMIGGPEDKYESMDLEKLIKKVYITRIYKLINIEEDLKGHPKLQARFLYNKLKHSFLSVSELDKQFALISNKYPFEKAKYCLSFNMETCCFLKEDLWDTTIIKNLCGEYRITKNHEQCLKIMYDDYRHIFPLENRLNELMIHYMNLKKYAKITYA